GEAGAAIWHFGCARGQPVAAEEAGREIAPLHLDARLHRILDKAVEREPLEARAAPTEDARDDIVDAALVVGFGRPRRDQIAEKACLDARDGIVGRQAQQHDLRLRAAREPPAEIDEAGAERLAVDIGPVAPRTGRG